MKSDILEPYQKCLSNNGGSVCLHSCFIQCFFFFFFFLDAEVLYACKEPVK